MPLDAPNLDDRDFDDLYREVLARVPVHTPEWTNLSESDPGVTLLQLFAFLADNLTYRANRIPDATRLKFLSLLGRGLRPAAPGTGFVTFATDVEPAPLPAGTVVRAGAVPFRTRRPVTVLPVEARVFWKQPRTELAPEVVEHLRRLHEPFLGDGVAGLRFYEPVELAPPAPGVAPPVVDLADAGAGPVDASVWVALTASPTAVRAAGNDPVRAVERLRPLVAGATLTLGVHPGPRPEGPSLDPARVVAPDPAPSLLVEASGPGGVPSYQRLTVTHAEDVLERPGVLDVVLPALDRLVGPWDADPSGEGTGDLPPALRDRTLAARVVTWLRLRRRGDGAPGSGGARLSWVGVNAARVVQAVRVERERVGLGTGAPDQRFRLVNAPVLVGEPDVAPVIEVADARGAFRRWERTDDLTAEPPDAHAVAVDPESGVIGFGSGLHGARPPLGAAVRVSYEHGGGPQGVVPAGAIAVLEGSAAGVRVTNPLGTWGGTPGETVADGERALPAWIRHRDRAVTAADFRDITLRTPGVDLGRVDVLPLYDPRATTPAPDRTAAAGAVTVLVVPRADASAPAPPETTDPQVLDAVCAHLDPRRLLTTQVFVRGARWVPVVVSIGIALLPGALREEVEGRVRAAVAAYLSPLTGGLGPGAADPGISVETTGASPTGWPLSTPVRVDDVGAAATRVAGVRHTAGVRLAARRDGTVVSDVAEIPMSGLELPFAQVHVVTGVPEDPAALLGASLDAPALVPVPVVPRVC